MIKKIILSILTVFFVTGFLAVDSQAGWYRRNRAYQTGHAAVVCQRPYRHYYAPAQVGYLPPAPVVYLPPAPVIYAPPAPVVYSPTPWVPGINVFFPGVNIRLW